MGVKGLGKIMRFGGFNLILYDKTTCVIREGEAARAGMSVFPNGPRLNGW